MLITCPSGFAGEARRLKGADIQALADKLDDDTNVGDSLASIVPLLNGVWERTTEPGLYPFMSGDAGTKPDWARLYRADIIGALFQIRVGSFRDGKTYYFSSQCGACKQRYETEVDLQVIIDKARPFPAATVEAVRAQQPLVAKLGARQVKFKLATLGDDVPAAKLRKQLVRQKYRSTEIVTLVDQVAMMTVSVEGEDFHGDMRRIWLWVKELDLEEIQDLESQYDAASGGYDTQVKVKCSNCRQVETVELPLAKSFLDPRKRLESEEPTESPTGMTMTISVSPPDQTPTS